MGLFDRPLEGVRRFLDQKRGLGEVREFDADAVADWPEGSSLILEEETAIELGNPGVGSLSVLLWTEAEEIADGRISLLGPDLGEIPAGSAPFGQILMVSGTFEHAFESYTELRDAVYETRLEGLMNRSLPSQQSLWCRVDEEAMRRGLSLSHLGAALIRSLRSVDSVRGAEAVLVTSGARDLEELAGPAHEAGRLVEALMKMNVEMDFDCDTCDYREVCESVAELKKIRKRLMGETRQ